MAGIRYRDITFQSALVARWAVFFDILGIEYLHEPQTFKIGSRHRSPSFFLAGLGSESFGSKREKLIPPGVFVDIQFAEPTEQEIQDALIISQHTKKHVCIFSGPAMTNGLEWWPTVLSAPNKCFFTQCPFCGRFGISSLDDERGQVDKAGVHSHLCMEEYKVPERYNVLSHCSQDLALPSRSPMMDIAYEGARTIQFSDANLAATVAALRRAVEQLEKSKTFCSPDVTEWIIANALKWAEEEGDFMHFDLIPWWVQHKKDLDAGVVPCTCYSCVGDKKRETPTVHQQPPSTPTTELIQ